MEQSAIVVPCYNEAERLDRAEWGGFAAADVGLIFVDDGSTDGTSRVLARLCSELPRAEALKLTRNKGKAEAVRSGMLHAIEQRRELIGYMDADLATPVDEMLRLIQELETRKVAAVTGARVALSGHHIERQVARHYVGRVFATLAAWTLKQAFYDTQCGAKVFRNTPLLAFVLSDPFRSRWAFDVELLGRLRAGAEGMRGVAESDLLEIPLHRWKDVGGSKVRSLQMVRSLADLFAIRHDLEARRARAGRTDVRTHSIVKR